MTDSKKNQLEKAFHLLFLCIALGNLTGRILLSETLDLITKPLLMPVLILIFYMSIKANFNTFSKFIFSALFFSWLGDIFLMFNGQLFFIFGLLSFLIAQINYIFAYRTSVSGHQSKTILQKKPYLYLPFILYITLFYGTLYPHLEFALKIPVVVYSICLILMGIFALNRYQLVSMDSFLQVLIGACLFIISDSVIALNKFLFSFYLSGFVIMLTYILAQYLIVMGCIAQLNPKKKVYS